MLDLVREDSSCRIYRKDDHSSGDYIFDFAFSDTLYDRITNVLLLKDTENED
jgi:hypothetical protein